jgi:hypothetical protein
MKKEIKSSIFTMLLLFSLLTGLGAYSKCFSATTSDLFLNLSAGGVSSLFTIFVIDKLIKDNENKKWKDAWDTSKSELIVLSNMLASYVSAPLGYKTTSYDIDPQEIEKSSREAVKLIVNEINNADMDALVTKMSAKSWEHLQINLTFIFYSLNQSVQIYSQIIPPEVLGKLLKTRKDFFSFYNSFGLLPELFTKPQSKWPENKGGIKNNLSIRKNLLLSFANSLSNYYKSLDELIAIIDEWKSKK